MLFKQDIKNLFEGQLFEIKKRISFKKSTPIPNILGDYLVTTDNGIFRLKGDYIQKISDLPCFGIAINKKSDQLFISSWRNNYTLILKSNLKHMLKNSFTKWETIYSIGINNEASRIHQISYNKSNIWIANTAKNSITKVCSKTGKWIANICPFLCSYGHPIDTDHNHINSILAANDYLLFTAFKANKKGVIGLVGKGKIKIFLYKNFGIHDCLIHKKKFFFSDSFSAWDNLEYGIILEEKKKKFKSIFKKYNAQFVRGISINKNELIIGSSNFGKRKERLKKNGTLIRIVGDEDYDTIKINASQIYDIIRADGQRSDCRFSYNLKYDEVVKILRNSFGNENETFSLKKCLVGPNAKKFNKSDQGDVNEYE